MTWVLYYLGSRAADSAIEAFAKKVGHAPTHAQLHTTFDIGQSKLIVEKVKNISPGYIYLGDTPQPERMTYEHLERTAKSGG